MVEGQHQEAGGAPPRPPVTWVRRWSGCHGNSALTTHPVVNQCCSGAQWVLLGMLEEGCGLRLGLRGLDHGLPGPSPPPPTGGRRGCEGQRAKNQNLHKVTPKHPCGIRATGDDLEVQWRLVGPTRGEYDHFLKKIFFENTQLLPFL